MADSLQQNSIEICILPEVSTRYIV